MRENTADGPDMPVGFSMALAQNPAAMDTFSALSGDQRRQVLEKSRRIRSRSEMRSFVDSLVGLGPDGYN